MKKTDRSANGEMRPEYDFAAMKGDVRAKYLKRLRERTNIVVLEPEVAEAFPNEQAVNQALRGVLDTARAVRRTGGLANKALHSPTRRRRKKAGPLRRPRG
jgi:hypothetical protein